MFGASKLVEKVVQYWGPLVIVSTIICGLIYLTVQQSIRQSANDPQIQMSEDVASSLEKGIEVQEINNSSQVVDIASSLSPYLAVYDDNGKVLTSTGQLNGQPPQLPQGLFDYVRNHHQTKITWQPQTGVRSAIVVTRFDKNNQRGFVMAGRSLREVEKRESTLGLMTVGTWAIALITSFLGCFVVLAL